MQNNKLSDVKGKELVAAGHAFAKAIGMDTPLIEMAKMVSELAGRLDCSLVRGDELEKQRDALAAENAALKQAADFATADDMWIEQHDGMLDYRYKDWYVDVLKQAMETPATDAIRNAIRAEGVIMFASKQLAAAGDLESTITLERLMLDAEEFAEQLRGSVGKDGE